MPLISMLASIISIFHHLHSTLSSIPALAIITTTIVGWIIQVSIWLDCEVSGPMIAESVSSYCPQYPLKDQGSELARGLSGGKIAFAWMAVFAGGIYGLREASRRLEVAVGGILVRLPA